MMKVSVLPHLHLKWLLRVCFVLFLFAPNLAQAATKYWIGNGDSFSDDTKWSTSSGGTNDTTAPGLLDDATFDGNSADCVIDSSISVRGIYIQSDYAGVLSTSGFPAITVTGTLQLQGGETLTTSSGYPRVAAGTVVYNGTSPSYTLKNWNYGNLIINGGASSVFSLSADLVVGGDLSITSGILDLAGHNLSLGGTFNNNGTLRLQGGEILDHGMVALYHLDETSGTFYDATRYANDASAHGIVGYAATGEFSSNAISLDGQNGDYISAADSPSLSLTGPFTLSAWINLASTGQNAGIIEKYEASGPDGINGYRFRVSSGKLEANTLSGSSLAGVTGTTTVSANTWHHVAAVYDGTNIKVYLDGVLDGSAADTINPTDGASELRIGKYGIDGLAGELNTVIDEVAIYKGALNASDVNALYVAGSASDNSFPMDTHSGTVEYTGAAGTNTRNSLAAGNNYYNLIINAGDDTLKQDSILYVNGDLSIRSGATLNSNDQDVYVAGNWSNSSTYTSGNNKIVFDGSGAQSFDPGTDSTYQNIDVLKSGGILSLINHDLTLYSFSTDSGDTGTFAQGSQAMSMAILQLNGGTYTGGSGTITTDVFYQNAGTTFTAPSSTLYVDWGFYHLVGSTFNHNSGTVDLSDCQTIDGSTTFYNLTATAVTTMTFTAGSKQTIEHTLTLHGDSIAKTFLNLRSSIEGTEWLIDPQGSRDISGYVDVEDSKNTNASNITCYTNCIDSTHNTKWSFVTPAINVSKSSVAVTEGGATDSFTVVLASQPTDDVSVAVSPEDSSYGVLVSSSPLTFTTGDWNIPQTVMVTAIDDTRYEGAHTDSISFSVSSNDGGYNGMAVSSVTATITDNDAQPMISIDSPSVTEGNVGTKNLTYSVTLSNSSVQTITVDYATSDGTATAGSDYTATSGTLTFTPGQTSKTIDVSVIGDYVVEVDETLTMTLSNPSNATTVPPGIGTGTILNDDTAGVTINESGGSTNVTEGGATDSYTLVLTSQPTSSVTLTPSSSDTTHGVTVSPSTLTFTTGSWNTPQTVTVTAVDDNRYEGPHSATITHAASGGGYNGVTIASVTANITDNDAQPALSIADSSRDEGNSGSSSMDFSVTLNRPSVQTITVNYATANVSATAGSDYTATSGTLTFNPDEISKTISVPILGDTLYEDDETFTLTLLSGPSNATLDRSSATGTILNDDPQPSVQWTSSAQASASESGTMTVTAQLSAASGKTTTVPFSIGGTATDGTDYTITASPLTIAAGETTASTTISIIPDAIHEGNETVVLTMEAPTNASLGGTTVHTATITDDDFVGVTITESGGSTNVTEGSGVTDSYTVVLTSEPTQDVVITVTPDDKVSTTPPTLTFTSGNWNSPQTVTVSAVDNQVADGLHTGTITHTATSSDTFYNGLSIASVVANVTDNDSPGVSIAESSGSTVVTEGGNTDTFTVLLSTQPISDVTITMHPDSQVTTNPPSLTFTASNWNQVQTVTVTAVDDHLAQGNHTGLISPSASSGDSAYNAIGVNPITVSIIDNDSAGVTLTQSNGSTTVVEGGATDSYTIALTSQPTSDVVITVNAGSGVTASPTSLTFTSGNSGNWSTPQMVTVTAVNNSIAQGIHTATITHTAASNDTNYGANLTVGSIVVSITASDSAGIHFSPSSLSLAEGGDNATLSIRLNSQPTNTVTINYSPNAQINVTPIQMSFTANNWNQAQSLLVSAVDDNLVEGQHTGAFTYHSVSNDANYNNLTGSYANISIQDNDSEPSGGGEGETNITLNVNAGSNQSLRAGASIGLSASVTPSSTLSSGSYTYVWSVDSTSTGSGTLSDTSLANPVFTAGSDSGEVHLTLNVTHSSGASGSGTLTLYVIAVSGVRTEDQEEHVVGVHGSTHLLQTTTTVNTSNGNETSSSQRVALGVGSAQITLPASANTQYSFTVTNSGRLIIGVPGEEGGAGRVYFSEVALQDLSHNINLGELNLNNSISRVLTQNSSDPSSPRRSISSINNSSDFTYVSGSQAQGEFGSYLASGDINGDGEDEILVGAPNSGPHGMIYIYDSSYNLTSTIFGSAEHPVSSVLVSNYLNSSSKADILLGPDNPALNQNLMQQGALDSGQFRSNIALLSSDARSLSGSVELSSRGVDADFGSASSETDSITGYQSLAVGDLNGDGDPDLVVMGNDGTAYIYLGRKSLGDHLSASDANVRITGGSATNGFGRMIAIADVSGDGIADLIIGAPDYGANHSGAIYVIFGSSNLGSTSTLDVTSSSQVIVVPGASAADAIGSDLLLIANPNNPNSAADIYTLKSNNTVVKLSVASALSPRAGQTDDSRVSGSGGCSLSNNAAPNYFWAASIFLMWIYRKKQKRWLNH
ncbi:MAG: FG-GAP repeat protein [Deltaproteobacteria bacterium]|nr:FG-GAP repeat protein [Deltaproteobacteria bacterium]